MNTANIQQLMTIEHTKCMLTKDMTIESQSSVYWPWVVAAIGNGKSCTLYTLSGQVEIKQPLTYVKEKMQQFVADLHQSKTAFINKSELFEGHDISYTNEDMVYSLSKILNVHKLNSSTWIATDDVTTSLISNTSLDVCAIALNANTPLIFTIFDDFQTMVHSLAYPSTQQQIQQ